MLTHRNFSTMTSDRWLISSTALALKSISMTYDLPKHFAKKLGVDGVGLTFAAENLFILSKRRGLNPFSGYTGVMVLSAMLPPAPSLRLSMSPSNLCLRS